MTITTITATEANRTFSNILNKVHYQGESYIIKRGKEVIAKIIPVAPQKSSLKVSELNQLFKRLPQIKEQDQQEFENDIQQIRAQMKFETESWD